jgi:bilirubin oxidase
VELEELLMAPAERADVIVDFGDVPEGTSIILENIGSDEPFGGGEPGIDFDPADPDSTGQVMEFRVQRTRGRDKTTPLERLILPTIAQLGSPSTTRQLSLNEEESHTVRVSEDNGNIVLDCEDGEVFGPTSALLGTVSLGPLTWGYPITENPGVGDTEVWEIYNYTEDAHPIHVHLVMFQVIGRFLMDGITPIDQSTLGLEPWETGWKDTVIAYPGEITKIKARFDIAGLYVWHCHIVEHEDNEMMRPYRVGPEP